MEWISDKFDFRLRCTQAETDFPQQAGLMIDRMLKFRPEAQRIGSACSNKLD